MKIGILTHHYINNFGAFLQAYALQETVQNMFPEDEVVIINYLNIKHFVINVGGWFRFYRKSESLKAWLQKVRLPITFYKERHNYMKMTRLCLTTKDINELGLDCIIIGSDEVWNYKETKGNAKVKWGYGLNCKRIIAYAPSVGKTESTSDIPCYIVEGLKSFSGLSARDDMTEEFIRAVTHTVPARVLDPTFLTVFPRAKLKVTRKPYILFYYCEHLPDKYMKQIVDYAHSRGLLIYGAGECNKIYNQISVNLTPFEWIEMFKNAELIFTGTFHGVVFSILNKKQFVCYLTNPSRIKKVGSLLKELKISKRILGQEKNIDDVISEEIDYSVVFKQIEKEKIISEQYIKEKIKG